MLEITLPLPPSVNHAYKHRRGGGVYLSIEAHTFKAQAWAALFGLGPVAPPVTVTIEMVVANQRKRDLDNILKLALDSLKDCLGFDDNDIVDLHVTKRFEKGGEPRLEVIVKGAGA